MLNEICGEVKMRVLTNGNRVDFEAPIQMQEDQLEKFVKFLGYLLNEEIEIREVKEKERFGNRSEKKQKKWTFDELLMLLNPNLDNSELAKKLDRSVMSISMERSDFVTSFISWAKSKGYNPEKITRTLVQEFMEERK